MQAAFCKRSVLVYFWSRWVFKEGELVLGCLSPVSLPVINVFRELCKQSRAQT